MPTQEGGAKPASAQAPITGAIADSLIATGYTINEDGPVTLSDPTPPAALILSAAAIVAPKAAGMPKGFLELLAEDPALRIDNKDVRNAIHIKLQALLNQSIELVHANMCVAQWDAQENAYPDAMNALLENAFPPALLAFFATNNPNKAWNDFQRIWEYLDPNTHKEQFREIAKRVLLQDQKRQALLTHTDPKGKTIVHHLCEKWPLEDIIKAQTLWGHDDFVAALNQYDKECKTPLMLMLEHRPQVFDDAVVLGQLELTTKELQPLLGAPNQDGHNLLHQILRKPKKATDNTTVQARINRAELLLEIAKANALTAVVSKTNPYTVVDYLVRATAEAIATATAEATAKANGLFETLLVLPDVPEQLAQTVMAQPASKTTVATVCRYGTEQMVTAVLEQMPPKALLHAQQGISVNLEANKQLTGEPQQKLTALMEARVCFQRALDQALGAKQKDLEPCVVALRELINPAEGDTVATHTTDAVEAWLLAYQEGDGDAATATEDDLLKLKACFDVANNDRAMSIVLAMRDEAKTETSYTPLQRAIIWNISALVTARMGEAWHPQAKDVEVLLQYAGDHDAITKLFTDPIERLAATSACYPQYLKAHGSKASSGPESALEQRLKVTAELRQTYDRLNREPASAVAQAGIDACLTKIDASDDVDTKERNLALLGHFANEGTAHNWKLDDAKARLQKFNDLKETAQAALDVVKHMPCAVQLVKALAVVEDPAAKLTELKAMRKEVEPKADTVQASVLALAEALLTSYCDEQATLDAAKAGLTTALETLEVAITDLRKEENKIGAISRQRTRPVDIRACKRGPAKKTVFWVTVGSTKPTATEEACNTELEQLAQMLEGTVLLTAEDLSSITGSTEPAAAAECEAGGSKPATTPEPGAGSAGAIRTSLANTPDRAAQHTSATGNDSDAMVEVPTATCTDGLRQRKKQGSKVKGPATPPAAARSREGNVEAALPGLANFFNTPSKPEAVTNSRDMSSC